MSNVTLAMSSRSTMKLSLLLMILILSQISCYHKVSYQLLGDVTEIIVMDQNQKLKVIANQEYIAQIVKSIDQNRHGWYMPIQGTPIPKIKLLFYNHGE